MQSGLSPADRIEIHEVMARCAWSLDTGGEAASASWAGALRAVLTSAMLKYRPT